RYSLLATRYSLLATRYSLLATRYSLLATRYSLLAIRCNRTSGPHALRERANEIGHRSDRARYRLAVGAETVSHRIDQRRADDNAVGSLGDGARMRGGAHAEADADRQFGVPLDPRHRRRDFACVRHRGAGHAGDR